jgi:hypothetical protein
MGLARFGKTALLPPRPTGIFCGRAPERIHELPGVLAAGQVAPCGPRGHGPRARAPRTVSAHFVFP